MQTLLSFSLILSTAALMGVQACSRRPIPEVPVTPDVSFETHIRPITSTVCIKCHTGKNNDFSQYKTAFAKRYRIKDRVVVDRTMPMGMYLSEQDRALFRDWVDQGAKE